MTIYPPIRNKDNIGELDLETGLQVAINHSAIKAWLDVCKVEREEGLNGQFHKWQDNIIPKVIESYGGWRDLWKLNSQCVGLELQRDFIARYECVRKTPPDAQI